ncbi:MAG: hypothetical protein OIF36_05430 [Alphaproteobacteria bacterium]|nr:hypothetical protein [Alphaproteobacteria bacterium]
MKLVANMDNYKEYFLMLETIRTKQYDEVMGFYPCILDIDESSCNINHCIVYII